MRPFYLHTLFLHYILPCPTILLRKKIEDLIERTFQRKDSVYIGWNDRNAFFTSDAVRNYNLWSCQKVCEALTFVLENIHGRFGSKLYRHFVGIPTGNNCVLLVAIFVQRILNLILLKLSILLLGIWMIY